MPSSDSSKSIPSAPGSYEAKASSSITCAGGTRPPGPIRVDPTGVPAPSLVTVADRNSVTVRPWSAGAPGWFSTTVASTATMSPTVSPVGVARTRMPSLVSTDPSPVGSCIQK